ncbi:MAG: hypothetical protein ACLGHL_02355 [Actinomycetota bacterium]
MRSMIVGLSLVVTLGACGGEQITDAASEQLQNQVATVREVASTGDPSTAREELDELVSMVEEMSDDGEIDEAKAREILAAAQDVEAELVAQVEQEAILNEEDDGDEAPEDEDEEDTKKTKPSKPTKGHSKDD